MTMPKPLDHGPYYFPLPDAELQALFERGVGFAEQLRAEGPPGFPISKRLRVGPVRACYYDGCFNAPTPSTFRSLSAGVRRSLGFPLCVSVKCAPVAQRTERVASDHQVAGSIPAGRARSIYSGSATASPCPRA